MLEHFGIADRFDLLVHTYEKFKKENFAGLAKRLCEAADNGDELCKQVFKVIKQGFFFEEICQVLECLL